MSNIFIFQKNTRHEHNRQNTVSVRIKDIAFNSKFVQFAKINNYEFVSVYLNNINFDEVTKLFFKFHNDATTNNTFNIKAASNSSGKYFTCASLLNSIPRLKILSNSNQKSKKLMKLEFDEQEKLWSCELPPNFEFRVRNIEDIDQNIRGIYKLTVEGRIQYFGRGHIYKRVKEHISNGYDFDQIHYSIINDPNNQINLETENLDEFEKQFGKLPTYNQIRGFNSKNLNENINQLPIINPPKTLVGAV